MYAKPLTKKQYKILAYIQDFIKNNGYNPSLREIAKGVNLRSVATVAQHINVLISKSMLNKDEKSSRSLTLTEYAKQLFVDSSEFSDKSALGNVTPIPLLGLIAAGRPIEPMDQSNETLEVPSFMVGKRNTYVLQVQGISMIDEGILNGDYVVIQENPQPQNGSVVVALLNGGATLKKYYKEKLGIRLQPSNKDLSPIYITSKDDLQIQGEAIGLIRKFA